MSYNSFAKPDIVLVAGFLDYATNLTEFHFAGNELSDRRAMSLIAPLLKCPNLCVVNFKNNNLKSGACASLAKLLSQHAEFASLNLAYNRISDSAIETLLSGFSGNTK